MKNLRAKLDEWVAAGLLDSVQAGAIFEHESKTPQRSWVLFGVVGIGVVVMMTGVISIIAANWEDIGAYQKLAAYFVLQILLGAVFYRHRDKPGAVREALLVVFALLFLGGIGLIGQIYNLKSDGWEGLLMWLVLAAPVMVFADGRLIFHLWFIALISAVALWVESAPSGDNSQRHLCSIGIAFLVFAFSQLNWRWISAKWAGTAFVWSTFILLGVLGNIANFVWAGSTLTPPGRSVYGAVPLIALAAAVCAVAFNRLLSRNGRAALIGMLLLLACYLCLPEYFPVRGSEIAAAAMYIAIWSCAAAAAAFEQRKRLFDICSFIIAMRFVIIYFEVFGSLTATGFGLFISGAVILGVTYGWNRFRQTMHQRLELVHE